MNPSILVTILATVLGWAVGFGVAQAPDVWELPGDRVYPEGIAAADGAFYAGSTIDGTIFRADLATGAVRVFAEDGQPTALGMAVDGDGMLWVAGGSTGNVYRYDTASGEATGVFTTPPSGDIFLNDVAVGRDGSVYVTDSQRPILYRVPPRAAPGPMDAWIGFESTPLTYRQGFNANGIVVTEDSAWIVVIQTNTGRLFRIGVSDRSVTPIDVDADLTNGDGLVLQGRTLYVVRNRNEEIVPVRLSEDFASGEPGQPIRADALRFPTTAALADGGLLVVSSQFGAMGDGEPELPFRVVRVPLP